MSGEPRSQRKFQGFVPANLDRSVIDRVEKVIEEDAFPLLAGWCAKRGSL